MNAHPRFTEPVEDTPDFTGFAGTYIVEDIELVIAAIAVPFREIRVEYEGDDDCLFDAEVRLTDTRGEFIFVTYPNDIGMAKDAALIRAVYGWLDAREAEIYAWAREQMESA